MQEEERNVAPGPQGAGKNGRIGVRPEELCAPQHGPHGTRTENLLAV